MLKAAKNLALGAKQREITALVLLHHQECPSHQING